MTEDAAAPAAGPPAPTNAPADAAPELLAADRDAAGRADRTGVSES
ncbi:hypothetical protein [Halobaculum lipolyticum]|uniref:Uncharacterized protein n=1 Tax=Halobaculum lipolyticum TaxID=3032001 RepID=A0ABD5WDF2_9EURY|nr:hypothetical protein [Halobaculum sp. DT31]